MGQPTGAVGGGDAFQLGTPACDQVDGRIGSIGGMNDYTGHRLAVIRSQMVGIVLLANWAVTSGESAQLDRGAVRPSATRSLCVVMSVVMPGRTERTARCGTPRHAPRPAARIELPVFRGCACYVRSAEASLRGGTSGQENGPAVEA
jgi:hypothetical protein